MIGLVLSRGVIEQHVAQCVTIITAAMIDHVERILAEEGLPEELIFLAQAESGFQPRAVSNKQCVGLWQFAQWPEQHWSPRGRWYLKLRENTRLPEAKSAEPIVSPAKPLTGFPSKVNSISVARSSRSPGRGGSLTAPAPEARSSAPRS